VPKDPKKFLPENFPPQVKTSESMEKFVIAAQSFSGPLPPPEILRKYEEVLPGSAERIISMAERQGSHRQDLESRVVSSNIMNEKMGMIFGFIICLVAISGGIYAVIQGKSAAGLSAIITPLGALVGVFIYGKAKQSKDLEQKRQAVVDAARRTSSR
jgi:uncharacterized membrane protein